MEALLGARADAADAEGSTAAHWAVTAEQRGTLEALARCVRACVRACVVRWVGVGGGVLERASPTMRVPSPRAALGLGAGGLGRSDHGRCNLQVAA